MKISIFTPTNNPKFLQELADSIFEQTYKNWEWVVVCNGPAFSDSTMTKALFHKIAEQQPKHGRIVVSRYEAKDPIESPTIGELKKYACSLCSGDIYVEVDHDDMLTKDALAKIVDAFESDPEIGFVYSKNAVLSDKFVPYDKAYGWTYDKFVYKDKELIAMNCQPLYPGRLSHIYFAPDHVRAWRASVYNAIGGHDTKLAICDDLDLMHRTYMVTKFKYIPEVLYIYRLHDNTFMQRAQQIASYDKVMSKTNALKLAERYADLNDLLKIDLCGGIDKPEGYKSIDLFEGDIIHDLNDSIPLPDNSVGVLRAFDALEHIKDSVKLMSEIHRVLAPGSLLVSMTPSTDGRGAFCDPTHVSFWNQLSFRYWTQPAIAKYIRNDKMFRECYLDTEFPTQWHKDNNLPYVIAHLEPIKDL